jgi:hypothetical protein
MLRAGRHLGMALILAVSPLIANAQANGTTPQTSASILYTPPFRSTTDIFSLSSPTFVMPFDDAKKPYLKQKYRYYGAIDTIGTIVNGGLSCSGFVSAVYHHMKYGSDWPSLQDTTLHQQYGEVMAERMGLTPATTITKTAISSRHQIQALIADGTLQANAVYFFNARRGKHGHVGFVIPMAGGRLLQYHYSDLYNGLATGELKDWYVQSLYGDPTKGAPKTGAPVTLYLFQAAP